ncbi:MAG: hypothetical protein LUC41_02320 [Clostridiales bacterium]|nr:hypothetical protein [Clostridiales bacterium]
MKLLFKQRLFSWFDSYDIYDEAGNTVYIVKGQLSWGHCLKIFSPDRCELGTVKEKVLRLLPKFEMYLGNRYVGCISRELTVLKPKYNVEYNGWHMEGNIWEWDYRVTGAGGKPIATVSKELFHLTDTYVIDVLDPNDALCVLMLVLAVDAEKCSRGNK